MSIPSSVTPVLHLMGQILAAKAQPGYRWPYGPICLASEHKAYTVSLDDYQPLIEQVEHSLQDNDDAAQRLRMMYYGRATKATPFFDKVLDSDSEWIDAPLTTKEAPQEVLDALMRFGLLDIGPAAGRPLPLLDVGHIWVLFDYVYNGLSFLGHGAHARTEPVGVINWTGDLGSWWVEFNDARQKAKTAAATAGMAWSEPVTPAGLVTPLQWLNDGQVTRCSAEDLLGDMDGFVLGAEIDNRGPDDPGATGPTPFAALLAEYYRPLLPPTLPDRNRFHSDNRFHLFVRHAKPKIPHDYDAATGAVTLKSSAQDDIRQAVRGAAFLFLFNARGAGSGPRVDKELDSPWGAAMLNEIAKRFTDFLAGGLAATDGWTLSGWPTLPKALAEYDGSPLHIGSTDTGPDGPVRKLQTRLKEMGFTVVGTPDGIFGPNTAIALRELQIAATYDRVYARVGPGPVYTYNVHDAIRRYFGPIHGVLDEATADIVNLWYEPQKYHRGAVFDRILNPLTIQTGTVSGGVPTLTPNSDVWAYNDVTTADAGGVPVANRVRVFAVDRIERYSIPNAEQYAGQANTAIIGRYTTYEADGGPVVDQKAPQGVWNSAKITMSNLIPATLDRQNLFVRSTYRVLRAVAEVECTGHYDSVNCYDPARLSLGLYHWALQPRGAGELAAFLAFFNHHYPRDFQAHFGRFGILPETLNKPWGPADWNMDGAHGQAKLVGRLALYGLHNSAGDVEAYTPLPLGEVNAGAPTGIKAQDLYIREYLRSWRVVHRVIMAMRLSAALQKVQWDFAILRLQTLLTKNWMAAVGDGPVVTDGAAVRPARFGEVFTSEKAVAALLRWHVNRPGRIIDGNAAVRDAVDAFTAVYGAGQVNLSNVPTADRHQRQRDLVQRLIDQAPAGWFRDSVNAALNYVDPDAGALQDTAGSFLLFIPT